MKWTERQFGYFTVGEWLAIITCHLIVYVGFTGFVLIAAYWQGWRP